MPFKPTGFIGFPDVEIKFTIIPDVFFTDLLPLVDDLAELKLTLPLLLAAQRAGGGA